MTGDANQSDLTLVYVVGRVHQGIRREMGARLEQFGLSVQEYTALSVLRARPGLSNAQLARRALVAPQSMIEILAKLERRGLVKRSLDPSHGRIRRADVTRAGIRLLDRSDPAIREVEDRVFARVPARERATIKRGLIRVMEGLSSLPSPRD